MSTPTPDESFVKKATAAVAVFAGQFAVNSFVHRLIVIGSAAAAAGATFLNDNAVLLGASPEQVTYSAAVAAFVATVARVFSPE
jgi:hypothetical protein